MSVASYPHVEISVRDDSIYTATETETLPLNKPLYMMRAQKGPLSKPVWCPTYTYAARVFGEDTFNKRSKYYSEQAYFLLKTFPSNGAFIMRVAGDDSANAAISIELGVSTAVQDIPQWKRDANGFFVTDITGNKIGINSEGNEREASGTTRTVYYRATETTAISGRNYFTRDPNYVYTYVAASDRRYKGTTYAKPIVPTATGSYNRPKFEMVTVETGDTPAAGVFYFEYTSTTSMAEPKFNLEAFETGKTYLKLTGFEQGFTTAADSDLPEIVAGQTIGDTFTNIISDDSIEIVTETSGSTTLYYGKGDDTNKAVYYTYRYIRAANEEDPYTYTAVTLPAGTVLGNETAYYYGPFTIPSGELEAQATVKGLKLAWRAHYRADYSTRPVGTTTPVTTQNFTWYPMLDVVAENPGAWGAKFGLKMFYDTSKNTLEAALVNNSVTYSLAPVQLVGDATTPTAITDAYGCTQVNGVVRPKVVDPESESDITIDKVLTNSYTGKYALPIQCTWINANWNTVGKLVMAAEIKKYTTSGNQDTRAALWTLYKNVMVNFGILDSEGNECMETFVDRIYKEYAEETDFGDEDGYLANLLSIMDCGKIPYFASAIVDSTDSLVTGDTGVTASKIFVPSAETATYLDGGEDGSINDWNIETYIRAEITAAVGGTQEYLIDYARSPFNAIYDTGVSVATKKSYLDFLTVRDSLVVNLATQVTWAGGTAKAGATGYDSNGNPVENGRAYDESIGSSLRAYAWLMKEDVANGTEACRCKIFLHAGYTSDHDGMVASTLWIAEKDAAYLNRTYIAQEPKELPNSDVSCWSSISWVASTEDTKSRCWNQGLNYVQFYTMSNYHYACVRSVYRYETSVLVDSGVVNALTFMKDEVRHSWAKFAGSTRPAAELNQLITDDLNSRYASLLNGKYTYAVSVYQTDEDVKLGYVRHVDIQLIAPATNRVWLATIICKREGYEAEA